MTYPNLVFTMLPVPNFEQLPVPTFTGFPSIEENTQDREGGESADSENTSIASVSYISE